MKAGKAARKMLIAANWKSQGTVSDIANLVMNVLNKIEYDPNKIGLCNLFIQ